MKFADNVQRQFDFRPSSSPNVQYLVCKCKFPDDVASCVQVLGSGLHVYAMYKDYSSDDAFLHHGKRSTLDKRERKQISDSINVDFKQHLQPEPESPVYYHAGAGSYGPHSPAQGWKTMFRT